MTTENLIPNAGGDETNLFYYDGSLNSPDVNNNYLQIDDPVSSPDDLSTYVIPEDLSDDAYYRDLYELPSGFGSGTINSITVHVRRNTHGGAGSKIVIKSDGTITEETIALSVNDVWQDISFQWTENPVTTSAWTWTDIGNLQIGVSLDAPSGKPSPTECTQIYVEIDYTVAAGTNKQINIGDVWKAIPAEQINIGDAWKNHNGGQINIGDVWKTLF